MHLILWLLVDREHLLEKESDVAKANYRSGIDNYEGIGVRTVPPSPTATAGVFCTYPQVTACFV